MQADHAALDGLLGMTAEQLPLPCPGQPSPVRPVAVVPVCRACPLWLRDAEFGPHQRPVARHDGERWRCERAVPQAAAASEPPLDASTLTPHRALPLAPAGAGGAFSS